MDCLIYRKSCGASVDLRELSIDEMRRIHDEEKAWVAEECFKLPPFSPGRNELLNYGYTVVEKIVECISIKKGRFRRSYGASKNSVRILNGLIKRKMAQKQARGDLSPLIIYEAGVGFGYSIMSAMSLSPDNLNIIFLGCDIKLHPNIREMMEQHDNLRIEEGHVYNCLSEIPVNSVDIFYADNVIEHFFPDEAKNIFRRITDISKPGADFLLVVPNKCVRRTAGYHGFHFMEMSFNEITEAMGKNSIVHAYCSFRLFPKARIFLLESKTLLKLKLALERTYSLISVRFLRKVIFSIGAYEISVMRKLSAEQ